MVSLEDRLRAHEPIAKERFGERFESLLMHDPGSWMQRIAAGGAAISFVSGTYPWLLGSLALGVLGHERSKKRQKRIDRILDPGDASVFYATRDALLYRADEPVLHPSVEIDGTLTKYLEGVSINDLEPVTRHAHLIRATHGSIGFEGIIPSQRIAYTRSFIIGRPVDLIVTGGYPHATRILDAF